MTLDDFRGQRFAHASLGLAMLVGIASTVELAAKPVSAGEAQLLGPTLIQQSPGLHGGAQEPAETPRRPSFDESKPDLFIELDEGLTAVRGRLEKLSRAAEAVATTKELQRELDALRKENHKLRAEIEAVRAERGNLKAAKEVAEAHAAELTKTVEKATTQAREMAQKLVAVAVRWRNAQFGTSSAQTRTSGSQEAEARPPQNALRSRIAELERSAEQRSVGTARLREQMDGTEQSMAVADSARTEAEARLGDMRERLQRAEQVEARISADLTRVRGELASAREQVAAAGQERWQIAQRAAALADERDELRIRLADATARLGWSEAVKAELEKKVAELGEARRTAARDAGQNLVRVETRVQQLNNSLGASGPAAGPFETGSGTPTAPEQVEGDQRAAAAPVEDAAAAATSQDPETGSAAADLLRSKTAIATHSGDEVDARPDQKGIPGGVPTVSLFADLPLEMRLHVQALLADLHTKLDEQGLMTTVPGELLFALNSDEVQVGAYDTLSKLAELIGMYDNRQVIIIGHSDAVGDAAYNKQLAERRAELFKQFLVDNFELAADRLSTEGQGEASPIASNATPQGRRANRRVEVLIVK